MRKLLLNSAVCTLLALKVLLNTAQNVKCRKEARLGVITRSVIFKVQLVILQGALVSHVARPRPCVVTF